MIGTFETAALGFDAGIFVHLGLSFTEQTEGCIVGELEVMPRLCNRMGYVHGGVLCTMMDAAACCSGLYSPPGEPARYAVTLSLTTQFIKPVRSGLLTVEGRQLSGGRKIFTSEAQVRDVGGNLIAHGLGTFSWLADSRPTG